MSKCIHSLQWRFANSKSCPFCIIEQLEALIVRAYTNGYGRGHNDTVESCYTDVYPCDQDTYFAEEVDEWIKEQEATK